MTRCLRPYLLGAAALCAAIAAAAPPPRPATFISPMGEPFRSDAGGPAPDLVWFRRADANGDGRLTLAEMRADAQRFFGTLDRNGDGEIDPDEIGRYETEVAPEIGVLADLHADDRASASDEGDHPAPPAHHGRRGAGRFGYFDVPEPVASADADFNRGVSRAEFDHAAQARFHLLDTDNRVYLAYDTLKALLPR